MIDLGPSFLPSWGSRLAVFLVLQKPPCYRKADAVEAAEAEVISSDDDFEKIAYPKNANVLLVLLMVEVGRMF